MRVLLRGCSLLVLGLLAATAAEARVTNFGADVNAAIDDGLEYLRDINAFTGSTSQVRAGRAMAVLALLEKRESADWDAAHVGYANSAAADQALARSAVELILADASYGVPRSFYAYSHGENMMALALYARTGGPEIAGASYTLREAVDKLVNDALVTQTTSGGRSGFWGYTGGGNDSSTTQFAAAGLAGAKGYYLDAGDVAAMTQVAAIDAALARTADGYARNRNADGGHGYRTERAYASSFQQTSSGLWCQILGGLDVNDDSVQAYLGWEQEYYNYKSIERARNSWRNAYYYYLWSSSKGYSLIQDAGIDADPGNLDPENLGTLPADSIPHATFGDIGRLVHRDPDADVRPTRRGADGSGPFGGTYYEEEDARWYYDYAYTLMTQHDADGSFNGGGHGYWNRTVSQAYAILVLERSLGGACRDTDDDTICDEVDNCPTVPNTNQSDVDGDGVGDVCDECPDTAAGDDPDPDRPGCPSNQPPVALCQDMTVPADDMCMGCASVDAGSFDPDGDAITLTQLPVCDYALGATDVSLDVSDGMYTDSCEAVVTVVDVTPPTIECNAPESITPPDAPICFTATAADNCSVDLAITGFDCWAINGAGKRIDKTESCVVEITGDTICVQDSGGVGDNIEWNVVATDGSGNVTETLCGVAVEHPNGGGCDSEGCNQGVGNGPEGCDPGNSNQGDPANSNDENGGTPGNPGKKKGKK